MCSVTNENQCKGPDPPGRRTFWQFVKGFFSNSKKSNSESPHNDRRTTGNLRTDDPGHDSPWRQI